MLWGVKIWMWWLFGAALVSLGAINADWLIWQADHHEGLASWVQAAGVIATIMFTAWLSSRESQAARQTKEAEARIFAYRVLPLILHLREQLGQVRRYAEETRFGIGDAARGHFGDPVARLSVINPISAQAEEQIRFLPPKAAKSVSYLIGAMTWYTSFINENATVSILTNPEHQGVYESRARARFEMLAKMTDDAIELLTPLNKLPPS